MRRMVPVPEVPPIAVASPAPYPEIAVSGPNLRYAGQLTQDISESKGEMTAIYQYLYQSWMLGPLADDGLAALLHRIAEVEMRHMDMLGRMAVLLGGCPRCRVNPRDSRTAWNGNMINDRTNIVQMLNNNIFLEESAVRQYQTQAQAIRDAKVSALLSRIALDEQIHANLFKDFLAQYTSRPAATQN